MKKHYIIKPNDLAYSRITKALNIEKNVKDKCDEFLNKHNLSGKRIVRNGPFVSGVSLHANEVPNGWIKVNGSPYTCYRPTRKYTSDMYDEFKKIPNGLSQSSLLSYIAHDKDGTLYFNGHSVFELNGDYYLTIEFNSSGMIDTTDDKNIIEKLGGLTPVKESDWLIAQGK